MAVGFWRLGAAIEPPPRERHARRRSASASACVDRAGRGPPAVGPVLARRVRRRVHPAEPDGVLVPRPVRRGAGGLGVIFFGANLLAAVSSLSAARIAARIGLINTMVFTHLPSNVLLILVPLMPTLALAVAVLLLRFSLSQMDVPTRQSYVIAVVDPDERSAAAGVTGIARNAGAAISPSLSSVLMANAGLVAVPFFLAGGLKIVYDLLLYRDFRSQPARRSRDRTRATPGRAARRGLMIRNQIQASTTTPSTARIAYSNCLRTPPIVSQFAPSWTPANTSSAVNGSEPRNEKSVKRRSGMCATPAANDTSERMTGIIRPKKLAASP